MRGVCLGLLCVLACDGGQDPYPSYQACFDDRTSDSGGLQVTEAIVVCCKDNIVGMPAPVCGTTSMQCTDYLAANLSASVPTGDKSAGCDQYIAGM